MALYGAVLPLWDPEIPIDNCALCCNDVGKCGHGQSAHSKTDIVDIENPEGWNTGVVTNVIPRNIKHNNSVENNIHPKIIYEKNIGFFPGAMSMYTLIALIGASES